MRISPISSFETDNLSSGYVREISPPDVYGIVLDEERGNKPEVFARETILQEAVFDLKPKSVDQLTHGTRQVLILC